MNGTISLVLFFSCLYIPGKKIRQIKSFLNFIKKIVKSALFWRMTHLHLFSIFLHWCTVNRVATEPWKPGILREFYKLLNILEISGNFLKNMNNFFLFRTHLQITCIVANVWFSSAFASHGFLPCPNMTSRSRCGKPKQVWLQLNRFFRCMVFT